MDTLQQANEVLSQAERSLRDLMKTAIAAGSYGDLANIAQMAEQVAAISAMGQSQSPNHATSAIRDERALPAARRSRASRANLSKPKKGRRTVKFVREGDKLVKIGWSKSDKAEYEHKAGHPVLVTVCNALAHLSPQEKLFTVEDLSKHIVGPDKSNIPAYQIYVCIAWLRSTGRIKQHGRKGYSIPRPQHLLRQVDADWNQLPQR